MGTIVSAALLLAWLQWLGRPWACQSQSLCLWGNAPSENSERLADAYSLLHLSFGILTFAALKTLDRNRSWSAAGMCFLAFVSLLVWEAVENVPAVIGLFDPPAGMASYNGDSILNAAGDVLFGLAGFLAARRISRAASAALVIGFDLATTILVADGLVLGTLRLCGVI